MRALLLSAALCLAVPAAAQDDPAASPADTPEAVGEAHAPAEEAWRPTARGVRTLGGSIYAAHHRDGDDRSLSASAFPSAGQFVADGLLIEVSGGLNGSRSRYTAFDGLSQPVAARSGSVGGALGPSVTKYFGALDARAFPFVGASVYGSVSRSRTTWDGSEVGAGTFRSAHADLRAGVMVPIARNFAIEAQLTVPVYDSPGDSPFGSTLFLSAGVATFLY